MRALPIESGCASAPPGSARSSAPLAPTTAITSDWAIVTSSGVGVSVGSGVGDGLGDGVGVSVGSGVGVGGVVGVLVGSGVGVAGRTVAASVSAGVTAVRVVVTTLVATGVRATGVVTGAVEASITGNCSVPKTTSRSALTQPGVPSSSETRIHWLSALRPTAWVAPGGQGASHNTVGRAVEVSPLGTHNSQLSTACLLDHWWVIG